MIHEDDRRVLEDWPEAKIITAKKDCRLGDHYHKIKTEKFILISGDGIITIENNAFNMRIGKLYTVNPGRMHSFDLSKGSVLLGICSHAFNSDDDYK